jgi:hypothetical protein
MRNYRYLVAIWLILTFAFGAYNIIHVPRIPEGSRVTDDWNYRADVQAAIFLFFWLPLSCLILFGLLFALRRFGAGNHIEKR